MIKDVLIVFHEGQQHSILPDVRRMLGKRKIGLTEVERDELLEKHYISKSLVVVIGGDGTFLRASHMNKNVPMFGINPNPENKEGFYMQAHINNFSEKIAELLNGSFKTVDLLRLAADVDNRRLNEYALNDIYVGDKKPYVMFNYDIVIGDSREFQRSSGFLVSTPSGSSAWTKSAGGTVLKMQDEKFEYVSRELYEGRLTKGYRLRKGILGKDEKIEIICKSPAVVVIDSIAPEFEALPGTKIRIYAAKDYLKYVTFV